MKSADALKNTGAAVILQKKVVTVSGSFLPVPLHRKDQFTTWKASFKMPRFSICWKALPDTGRSPLLAACSGWRGKKGLPPKSFTALYARKKLTTFGSPKSGPE